MHRELKPMRSVREEELGYIQMPFFARMEVESARRGGMAWIIGLNDWWLHCVHDQGPRNWDFEQRAWDQLLALVDQGELVLLDRDTTSRMRRPACRQVEGKWVLDDGLYWHSHFRWHLEGRLQRLEVERIDRERWAQQRAATASGPEGLPTELAVIKPATLGPHVGRENPACVMPQKKVPCFELNGLPHECIPEFDRQISGQQTGLNDLTVEEYLNGREAFKAGEVKRSSKAARDARENYRGKLTKEMVDEFVEQGLPRSTAKIKAAEIAAEKMKTLAALHNPDMVAAGKDEICDFGDRNINSRLGAQWKSRVGELDKAASNVPESARAQTKMNAQLERCR